MKSRNLLLSAVILLAGFVATASAAPRVDPELTARLAVAEAADQFGVILTFHGNSVTDAQVAQVRALGVRMGVRMTNFPILGINATPSQIQQMAQWDSLRSIYLNAPLQLNMHQTRPLIGVDRLRADAALTFRNGGTPVSGRGVTIAINDSGIDGSHQDLTFNPLNPQSGKTIQNVLVNPNDQDGLIVRPTASATLSKGYCRRLTSKASSTRTRTSGTARTAPA
jgi:serine protease AprX